MSNHLGYAYPYCLTPGGAETGSHHTISAVQQWYGSKKRERNAE